MSKCGCGKGGEGNPAISKYGGGSPASKNPYLREGAAPFKAFLYGSDIFAAPRFYAADPIGRYRTPYAHVTPALYRMHTIMERYAPPESKTQPRRPRPLLPFKASIPEMDTFRGLDAFYRSQDSPFEPDAYTERLMRPPISLTDELEEKENRRKKIQMNF